MIECVGPDSLSSLPQIVQDLNCKKVYLVTGQNSFRASGAAARFKDLLPGEDVEHFDEVVPNPSIKSIEKAVFSCPEGDDVCVVAVGGGSVLDTGKLVSVFAKTKLSKEEMLSGKVDPQQKLPFIAVPTTAGSGSEATHFASIFEDGGKTSVQHPCLLPEAAIVDWTLSANLPAVTTAYTGLDCLCQAMESFWSRNATAVSMDYAKRAMVLAWKYLPQAVAESTPESRAAMAEAAFWAGKAINISFTTLCHSLSYVLTSDYGIPHGHAVAVFMPGALRLNEGSSSSVFEIYEVLGAKNGSEAAAQFEALMTQINCATRLSDLGVATAEEQAALVHKLNHSRLRNNPKNVSEQELLDLVFSAA